MIKVLQLLFLDLDTWFRTRVELRIRSQTLATATQTPKWTCLAYVSPHIIFQYVKKRKREAWLFRKKLTLTCLVVKGYTDVDGFTYCFGFFFFWQDAWRGTSRKDFLFLLWHQIWSSTYQFLKVYGVPVFHTCCLAFLSTLWDWCGCQYDSFGVYEIPPGYTGSHLFLSSRAVFRAAPQLLD